MRWFLKRIPPAVVEPELCEARPSRRCNSSVRLASACVACGQLYVEHLVATLPEFNVEMVCMVCDVRSELLTLVVFLHPHVKRIKCA